MAELLVYQEVPWAALLGVAAFDEARATRARRTLAKVGRSAKVEVRKGWYF